MPIPYWVISLIVIAFAAYALYLYLHHWPILETMNTLNIEDGIATPRDSYFMRQDHTYFSNQIMDISEVLEKIDLDFLKRQFYRNMTLTLDDRSLTYTFPVVWIKSRLVGRDKVMQTPVRVVFEQIPSEQQFVYRIRLAENPLPKFNLDKSYEKQVYSIHNVFVTHIEKVLKSMDVNIEVERVVTN